MGLERRKVAWESVIRDECRETGGGGEGNRVCVERSVAVEPRAAGFPVVARMCGYEARGWKLCIK